MGNNITLSKNLNDEESESNEVSSKLYLKILYMYESIGVFKYLKLFLCEGKFFFSDLFWYGDEQHLNINAYIAF